MRPNTFHAQNAQCTYEWVFILLRIDWKWNSSNIWIIFGENKNGFILSVLATRKGRLFPRCHVPRWTQHSICMSGENTHSGTFSTLLLCTTLSNTHITAQHCCIYPSSAHLSSTTQHCFVQQFIYLTLIYLWITPPNTIFSITHSLTQHCLSHIHLPNTHSSTQHCFPHYIFIQTTPLSPKHIYQPNTAISITPSSTNTTLSITYWSINTTLSITHASTYHHLLYQPFSWSVSCLIVCFLFVLPLTSTFESQLAQTCYLVRVCVSLCLSCELHPLPHSQVDRAMYLIPVGSHSDILLSEACLVLTPVSSFLVPSLSFFQCFSTSSSTLSFIKLMEHSCWSLFSSVEFFSSPTSTTPMAGMFSFILFFSINQIWERGSMPWLRYTKQSWVSQIVTLTSFDNAQFIYMYHNEIFLKWSLYCSLFFWMVSL